MARKKGKPSGRGSAPKGRSTVDTDLDRAVQFYSESGYPPAEERQKIIDRRYELTREMIRVFVESPDDSSPMMAELIQRYGQRDVIMVMNFIRKNFERPSMLTDPSWSYATYRRAFARWGGARPFLSSVELDQRGKELTELTARREMAPISFGPGKHEKELRDLTLTGANFYLDILPLDVPPRPADFTAPAPDEYSLPVAGLLEWGFVPDQRRLNKTFSTDRGRWQAETAHLRRMVLDEGLLAGWPGEVASWAPEHALLMLRLVKPGADYPEMAGLAALADRPNDWLSYRLPDVWSVSGPEIEPALWAEFEALGHSLNRRLVVLAGLLRLAQEHPNRQQAIISKLADFLSASPREQAELNGYIIHALNQLEATQAKDAVRTAFDEDRVDREVMAPEDIDWI